MPLYEYECTACHRHTEKIQKLSDLEITTCPHCGGELKRVISAPAFSLKGGGWYADGYGSQKPAAASESGSGGSDKGESAAPAKDGAATTPAAAPAAGSTPAPSAPAAPAASSSSSSGEKK